MYNNADDIALLLKKQLQDDLSPVEKERLQNWMETSIHNKELVERFMQENNLIEWLRQYQQIDLHKVTTSLSEKIPGFKPNNPGKYKSYHRVHFLRTAWFRVAVAIIIIFGIGAYLWQTNRSSMREGRSPTAETSLKAMKNDVLPGSNKAILTLSDGRKIILDSTAGKTITEGDLQIQHNNNGLIYANSDVVVNNTMSTPKGGQYKLTLSDGTQVWLNAASSITFPTTFKGLTREVSITGEAYFEVATNKSKPFIVKTISDEIQVLGTSFNINAYSDAPVKTSLLEGSVKIKSFILKPGQAFINGKIISTDIDQDIAWQKGYFQFKNADLQTVMRQLSRWYDIEVRYEGAVSSRTFTGKLPRKLSLQQLLRLLKSMDVNFALNGNVLIIR